MWNISEIKEKKAKVIQKIKNCSDPVEKEKLQITLSSYISMLDNSGSIRYTKFYNLMDKITNGNFTLIKPSTKFIIKGENIIIDKMGFIDEEYLAFLIELTKNVAKTKSVIEDPSSLQFSTINYSNEELVNISKAFYSYLGDKEIYNYAIRNLDDPTSLNFSTSFASYSEDSDGITCYDYIYNKAYCATVRSNKLWDLQANNHEIMHSIDFYMQPKLPTQNYYGFHEIPTYTIDYLFINYLDTIGIDKEEVQLLRIDKDDYLQWLAFKIDNQIQKKLCLLCQKNNITGLGTLYSFKEYTEKDVIKILDPYLLKDLLELESGIIAYGLYKQFKENYELGLQNLKTIMKTPLPKTVKPDFSNIGLPDEALKDLSLEIGNYSREYNTGKRKR